MDGFTSRFGRLETGVKRNLACLFFSTRRFLFCRASADYKRGSGIMNGVTIVVTICAVVTSQSPNCHFFVNCSAIAIAETRHQRSTKTSARRMS
jgi:hypothetical protein